MRHSKPIQWLLPLGRLREARALSERAFAEASGVSRITLRQVEARRPSATLDTLIKIAQGLERRLAVLLTPQEECDSDLSTVAVSLKVVRDGDESWKSHFFEMVDEFRRTLDPRLLLLPPSRSLAAPLRALLASMALALCEETGIDFPEWANKGYFLDRPWFPSETESLKATACLESPLWFRRNNIFVLGSFMERA